MELIGKLSGNGTSKVQMIPSDPKYVPINFVYQYIHMINNKSRLNGLKGSTKVQNRESAFKYQSGLYNVQRNSDVNHRGMKIRWNKKTFS